MILTSVKTVAEVVSVSMVMNVAVVGNVSEPVYVSMARISASVRTVKVHICVCMVAEREDVKNVEGLISASMAFRNIRVRYVHLYTLISLHGMMMRLSKKRQKRSRVFMEGTDIFAMIVGEKASVFMVSNVGDVKNVKVAISVCMVRIKGSVSSVKELRYVNTGFLNVGVNLARGETYAFTKR